MTENPDAVKVGGMAVAGYRWPTSIQAEAALSGAILGARAMQAAMPAPAGVRVRPSPQIGEEADKYCAERGERWTKAFRALRNYCMGNMADEDGGAYPLVDLLTRPGDPITDGEFELISIVDEILSAIEDAGAREGAAPALNLHDAYAREMAAKDVPSAPTPAGAGDLVERARNAERNITGRLRDTGWAPTRAGIESARNHIRDLASRIEALEAEVAEARQIAEAERTALRRNKVAHEADLAALRAEVERVRSDREFVIGWNDGWQEAIKQNLRFPTMLRKMWSGGEVQAWIDEAMGAAKAQRRPLGDVLSACDWPEGKAFGFRDDPGEHEPCYVIMPDGGMIVFNHHAGEGVDIARARFVQSACNAALAPAKGG